MCSAGTDAPDRARGGRGERCAVLAPRVPFIAEDIDETALVHGHAYPPSRCILPCLPTHAHLHRYMTTQDGRPVQQGEGGFGGAGIEIWHNYNTSSFEAVPLDDKIFEVPAICATTVRSCAFP